MHAAAGSMAETALPCLKTINKSGFHPARWYARYRRDTVDSSSTLSSPPPPSADAPSSALSSSIDPEGRAVRLGEDDLRDTAACPSCPSVAIACYSLALIAAHHHWPQVRFMVDGNPCLPYQKLARCRVRVGNVTFVGLPNPYSASVVMTQARLRGLLSSAQWLPNHKGNLFSPSGRVLIGPRETAASGDAYLNFTAGSEAAKRSGCENAMVVPAMYLASGALELGPEAGLRHLLQRYPFSLPVSDCLDPRSARAAGDNTWQLASKLHLNFSGQPCPGCRLIERPV